MNIVHPPSRLTGTPNPKLQNKLQEAPVLLKQDRGRVLQLWGPSFPLSVLRQTCFSAHPPPAWHT